MAVSGIKSPTREEASHGVKYWLTFSQADAALIETFPGRSASVYAANIGFRGSPAFRAVQGILASVHTAR